jgi:DNA (cytosine-5)-methyltransferase 1
VKKPKLIIDSFAGGGGASLGIAWATGRGPDIALNHDPIALSMHEKNHPSTLHVCEDAYRANLQRLVGRRKVGLLWASPDCRDFSRAKGDKPVSLRVRSLAWMVVTWAKTIKPDVIILENVREFEEWGPVVPMWRCKACEWKGTEGQAILKRKRRRCPRCNSVRLVMTERWLRVPEKKGITFKRWRGRLKALGYVVQHKTLDAADFGAPTHRKRLFLVARRDGKPIVWPEHTHANPKRLDAMPLFDQLKPWRTAAECIDWNIPCPSIFERTKPLAEKTLRRIALGIKRYVLDNPQPFIVGAGGPTYGGKPRPVDQPMKSLTQENHSALVSPYLVPITHAGERRANSMQEPLPTVTTANRGEMAVIAPIISRYNGQVDNESRCKDPREPFSTLDTQPRFAVVAPTLIQTGYGERDGQAPRSLDLHKPLGAAVAGGAKHAVVAAYLAKHFGGMVGVPIETPLPTTTVRGTQNQIVAANLVHLNHGEKTWNGVDEPLRTVTTGNHAALVYSFLVKYFGTAIGANLLEPAPTVTVKDRFGLVTVTIDGELYVIADIGMRMLTPRELARAQGFPDTYILWPKSKTKQTAFIGNSVSPCAAAAMVRANCLQGKEAAYV